MNYPKFTDSKTKSSELILRSNLQIATSLEPAPLETCTSTKPENATTCGRRRPLARAVYLQNSTRAQPADSPAQSKTTRNNGTTRSKEDAHASAHELPNHNPHEQQREVSYVIFISQSVTQVLRVAQSVVPRRDEESTYFFSYPPCSKHPSTTHSCKLKGTSSRDQQSPDHPSIRPDTCAHNSPLASPTTVTLLSCRSASLALPSRLCLPSCPGQRQTGKSYL